MRNRGRLRVRLIFSLVVTFGLFAWVLIAGMTPQLGLDLAGGTSVVLTAKGDASEDTLGVAVDIMRSRVDDLGVSEPEITREGTNNIIVQLPGLENEDEALDVIGTTAELGFRRVKGVFPASGTTASTGTEGQQAPPETTAPGEAEPTPPADSQAPTEPPTTGPTQGGSGEQSLHTGGGKAGEGDSIWRAAALQAQAPTEPPGTTSPSGTPPGASLPEGLPPDIQQQLQQQVQQQTGQTPGQPPTQKAPPLTPPDQFAPGKEVVVLDKDGRAVYQLGPEELSGREVRDATAQISGAGGVGEWVVTLKFTGEGDSEYKRLTGEAACAPAGNPERQIAIVLDKEVVSAPQVDPSIQCNQGISGGGVITLGGAKGQETEAKDLARLLRYGSLPVVLETSNIETVSPTLGRGSLKAGILAAVIGLVLVAAYAILFYRLFGMYIISGLAIYGMLIYVFVCLMSKYAGLTLTLAGLAAVVVSIGINADSAIVIIERIKDELHEGRTIRTSADRGYARAFRTVLAADTVSALAAITLYFLTVGSVRGFALMLGVSTVLDVLITICVIKPMVLLSADTWLFANEHLLFWRRPDRLPSARAKATAEATT